MAERKWHNCPHCGAPLEEAGQRSYGWKCVYCGGVMLEDKPDYSSVLGKSMMCGSAYYGMGTNCAISGIAKFL